MREYDDEIINAFARYRRTVDLVRVTGLSRNTICTYKKDDGLLQLAEERRNEIVKESVYKMQAEISNCVDTIIEIRDDPESTQNQRLRACDMLLTHCKDYTLAVDLMERVEVLERIRIEEME